MAGGGDEPPVVVVDETFSEPEDVTYHDEQAAFVSEVPEELLAAAPSIEDVADAFGPVASDERALPEADARDAEPWRNAIADALAEPPDVVPPAPVEGADPFDIGPGSEPAKPSAEPKLAPLRTGDAWADGGAPSIGVEAPAAAPPATAADADAASFTAAAEDLFRPPETIRDPHLITIGRRLDPALRIPRPLAPDIEPRAEPARVQEPWWKTAPWGQHLRTAARYAAYAIGGYLALVLVLIVLFRFVNPPGSSYMLGQLLTGTAIDRTWVPLGSISANLVRAVIVSEDGRFCEHSGIDTAAIKEAIERAARGTPRGASTISMQVTKNLFLWNAKSYVRKVIEIPLTLAMELVWPKSRILEVYLNIAEWAPGVFGAEAAAQRHFNKSAARLSEREAALLAAVLPNPVVRDAGSPGPRTSAKARVVQARVKAYGAVASCVASAAARPPAATAPAATTPRGTIPRTIRKAPATRPAPAKKKQQPANDWAPILNFGTP
ncbi:MAG: monofunctional biosynthetic peptidoglycan transglycosylase [Hyphomicrobium sp.]|nr:monofunctional biosynthetic peptidoglycan transglycosylase [Hyphomicrobium sp.]